MKTYNVAEISEMLSVDPETVRRWIRSGKLEAELTSRKEGNLVTEENLHKFLENNRKAKYAVANAVGTITAMGVTGSVMGVLSGISSIAGFGAIGGTSILAASIITGIASRTLRAKTTKHNKADEADDAHYYNESIIQLQESIVSKQKKVIRLKKTIDKLQTEIQEEQNVLKGLETLLQAKKK